jgi:hypothetical protein
MRQLRTLSEAECYLRCYGGQRDGIRVIRVELAPRGGARITGESLRQAFEERLDAREPEAA